MKLPRVLVLQLCSYRAPEAQGENMRHCGQTKHRGQALLLAVLLMLFAALLGATFVTVVAFNLSQTARNESKKSAEAAAQAGVRIANDQLVNSEQGENWRPEMLAPPPAPGEADYNTYYTPFEIAQGWARGFPRSTDAQGDNDGENWATDRDLDDEWIWIANRRAAGQRAFVKFPDPRLLTAGGKDTPTFLMEVTPITSGPNAGLLKVDVIGRSEDNDAAFYRQVVYKGTSVNGGPLSFPVYVANYDTQKKALRATTITAGATVPGTGNIETVPLTVRDASLFFRGQTVILSQSDAPTARRNGGVVSDVNTGTNQVTVRFYAITAAAPYQPGAQLRAAATLMNNLLSQNEVGDDMATVALDGDGARNQNPAAPYITSLFAPPPSTNGLYFGAGLLLDGKSRVDLDTSPTSNDVISITGPVLRARTNAVAKINADQTGPAANDFPESTVTNRTGVISSRVRDIPNSEDGVPVLAPPSLAGTDGKYTRYLSLTRDADRDNGSQYGYGPGVYIDNSDDLEKVQVARNLDGNLATGTNGNETISYRVLDNWEMHRLWLRKSFAERAGEVGNVIDTDGGTNGGTTGYRSAPNDVDTNDYHRLAWPRPGVDTYGFGGGSLEQRGIRGWVSPWEFLPRGTLIELNGNIITITRDERSDSGGGTVDSTKAWRYAADGSLLNSLNRGENIFRMTIDISTKLRTIGQGASSYSYTPADDFNGVIFAEGNVRVRGVGGAQDLTIVSKGNIYIEGNVREAGGGRIALLAKRNVIVNPTQFVARPEGMRVLNPSGTDSSLISGLTAAAGSRISNVNASEFRVGDMVQLNDGGNWVEVERAIAGGTPATSYIDLSVTHGLALGSTVNIRRMSDPAFEQDISSPNGYRFSIPNSSVALVRDIRREGAALGDLLLTWRHGATNVPALQLRNTSGAAQTYSSKPHAAAGTTIAAADQIIRPGSLLYDLLDVGGDGTEGGDAVETFDALRLRFNRPDVDIPADPMTNIEPDINWELIYSGYNYPGTPLDDDIESNTLPNGNVAARRIASMNWLQDPLVTVASDADWTIPYTVSLGVFWRPDLATWTGLNATTTDPNNRLIGSAFNAGEDDSAAEVRSSFYGSSLTRTTYGNFTPANINGINRFGVRHSLNPTYTGAAFPTYYASMPKVEKTSTADAPLEIEIQATVLAEEGSWFVLPAPMNQPESTIADSTRYRRYNYSIDVEGTIAQNFTPTAVEDLDDEVTPDAELNTVTNRYIPRGAMAQWIDANARPTMAPGGEGNNWLSITYTPSPLLSGQGEDLKLPVSPDWVYVS